ncbi:hypothetical protein [Sphingopyxis sp.]|uniref:hypothetical protein n=1 Tax=Sphingopyxis sp. TaxID=1908224 RepID=UPI003BAB3610
MMRMIVFFLSQILHALIVLTRSAANRFLKVNRTSAASIEKPIHNVKVPMNSAEALSKSRPKAETVVFISGKRLVEPIGIEPMT